MKFFVYRIAIGVKDLGERLHCLHLIRLGYALRELVWKR
jgi:hypothetical protein